MNSHHLTKCIESIIGDGMAHNIAVRYGIGDKVLGEVYRSCDITLDENTLFDMASVTKILATTPLCLLALDKGLLNLEDKITSFYDCNNENDNATIKHLLTHTFGIGHKSVCEQDVTNDCVAEFILNIPKDIAVGSDVLYSCPAFILLGKVLEKIYKMPLNIAFLKFIAQPIGMTKTTYLKPIGSTVNSNAVHSEAGLVNDYNCRFLGGIAGNAGIFSCMNDMTKFALMLINNGAPLISEVTFTNAIKNHTPDMSEARGLGFLYVDEHYSQTGDLFEIGSFGHCGHTGQSIFVNPKNNFYAIILSDMTVSTIKKFGQENYDDVIRLRAKIHNAIKNDLDRS